MARKKTVALPVQYRGGAIGDDVSLRADTANAEARTVDMVWSTGARVRRFGLLPDHSGYGPYFEELALDDKAVDLARMNNGAPLLNSHNRWELADVIGVVVEGTAKIAKGAGTATVRFSERDDVTPIFEDVKAGIIRNVSVGYSVQAYEVTRKEGEIPVFKATRWTPMEVSAVPIGADESAGFRSTDKENPCTIETMEEEGVGGMSTKDKKADGDPAETRETEGVTPAPNPNPVSAAPAADGASAREIAQAAVAEERQRAADIRAVVRKAGLDDAIADDLIDRGVSLDAARAVVIDKIAEEAEKTPVRSAYSIGTSHDDPSVKRLRMADAIAARYVPGADVPEAAREYAGVPVVELARDLLAARGENVRRLRAAQVIERAMGTSDFPILLQETGNRILMPSYQQTPATYQNIARATSNTDFRAKALIRDGDFPELLPKNENGEFKYGSMTESKETIKLTTVGRRIRLTREALINDDLGAFAELAVKAGQAARRYENKTTWEVVTSNAKLSSDGKALFQAADHKNLAAAGAAISVTTVGAGKHAIRVQTNGDGNTLNYAPAYIAVPSALETVAEQYLSTTVFPAKESDIVPVSHKKLMPVVEPLLDAASATAWYLFVDPSQLAAIIYAHLEGYDGPQMAQREISISGIEYEVLLDFAAAPVDYRAAYKNPGA